MTLVLSGEGKRFVVHNSNVAPTDPQTGMLWYDTSTNELKYYDGTSWVPAKRDGKQPLIIVGSSTWDQHADVYCDGADDQVEIQDALNEVSSRYGGGIVLLSPGTFIISDIIEVPDNVYLVGAGKDVTIIKQADGVNLSAMIQPVSGGTKGWIMHMTLDGNSANNTGTNVLQNPINADHVKVINSPNVSASGVGNLYDCEFDKDVITGGKNIIRCYVADGYTLNLNGSGEQYAYRCDVDYLSASVGFNKIESCKVRTRLGISSTTMVTSSEINEIVIQLSQTVYIVGNKINRYIKGNVNYGVYGVIANNHIVGTSSYSLSGRYAYATISGNRITNTVSSPTGALILMYSTFSGNYVSGAMLVSSSNGSVICGNMFYNKVGIYNCNNCMLTGNHIDNSVEISNSSYISVFGNYIYGPSKTSVKIYNSSNNIAITDNTFYSTGRRQIEIYKNCARITISNNIFYSGKETLYLDSDTYGSPSNIVFTNNIIYSGGNASTNMIQLNFGSRVNISNNIFIDSKTYKAIEAKATEHLTISKNTFIECGENNVTIHVLPYTIDTTTYYPKDIRINENTIKAINYPVTNAIKIEDTNFGNIVGNSIYHIQESAIYLAGARYFKVMANNIDDVCVTGTTSAIYLTSGSYQNSTYNSFSNNSVTSSSCTYCYEEADANQDYNIITCNHFLSYTTSAMNVQGTNDVVANNIT